MSETLQTYDTTLRDGAQMQGISYSVADKLKILTILDDLGIDIIEGGWPGANPKDIEFFGQARKLTLQHSRLAAFGSTRRTDSASCAEDSVIKALLEAGTPVIAIVGKCWLHQVEIALRTTAQNNIAMVSESVAYLKAQDKYLVFDAEHFFDGYKDDSEYAEKVFEAAYSNGADVITLCDTNGGNLPQFIASVVQKLKLKFPNANIGVHTHNDCGLALANALAAVEAGAMQIQGTINGFGERCGNMDLVSAICNLELKMNRRVLPSSEHLTKMTRVSRLISEIANFNPATFQPFVGDFAFTHKGGLHASAMRRSKVTYEHIDPTIVGNRSRISVSEQAGVSNLLDFAQSRNIELGEDPDGFCRQLLAEIKDLEHQGHQFENASASLVLLMLAKLGRKTSYYHVDDFKVFVSPDEYCEATVRVSVGDREIHTATLGVGPGHSLDLALRKALTDYYPQLKEFKLTDFRVRVVDGHDGTASKTRVNVETTGRDGRKWFTAGLHRNIVQATFDAIDQSIAYGLYLADAKSLHSIG